MLTIEYLDAVKLRHGLTSDYQLAKLLKITTSSISGYRSGRSSMDATTAVKIAEVLAIDPLKVIADSEIERARRPEVKNFWMRYAASVFITIAAATGAAMPPPAQAAGTLHNRISHGTAENTHCATKRRRKSKTAGATLQDAAEFAAKIIGVRTHRCV